MALRIDVVSLFPKFFQGPLSESILKRAQEKKQVEIKVHDLRDYTHDRHRTVDDKPFGGGAGMVIKPEPVFECLEDICGEESWVVLLSPHGQPFRQEKAAELAGRKQIVLIAGHYEGLDYRIHEHLVDEEVSIGDFVTMGGEAPAVCVIEAVVRLLPGVLGNSESLKHESFHSGHLEYPQYTRPRDFKGWKVPEVLVSGNHREVEDWRKRQARKLTREKRPDLIKRSEK
ncbi:MAG: tRNA (guanosine(37)-N1)-methyltransferase TrmD [Candidatus Omnitrophica bacterium]|nr:tRNA (guanosine(37)-N1)-methyltransferase TrmD [Candidatus Omnitrophota bacterium]